MHSRKHGPNLRAFGERLRRVRFAYGEMTGRPKLTHEEFATDLGIERGRYGRYDRGELNPPMDVLEQIRRVTGISLDFLIAGMRNGFDGMAMRQVGAPITVGERLTWARETQWPYIERVARTMGVSTLQWQHWEENIQPLPVEKAVEFAHRFSVTVSFLYEGKLAGIAERVLAELLRAHPELEQTPESQEPPMVAPPPASKSKAKDARRTPPPALNRDRPDSPCPVA